MAENLADKIRRLEVQVERLPLFSIADLRLLALSVQSWQEAQGADGTAVVAELERLVDEMCQSMAGMA